MDQKFGNVDLSDRFAEMWRQSRHDGGKSQDYMAKALDVSKATVQSWENGTSCPSQKKGFQWFQVLGLQPIKYYLKLLHPEYSNMKTAKESEIDDLLLAIIKDQPLEQKLKLLYILSGEHGSSPAAVLEMANAHLQAPLRDRINIALSISTNYELAKITGKLTCPDLIQPNMEMLNFATRLGMKAVSEGRNEYSALFNEQAVNI